MNSFCKRYSHFSAKNIRLLCIESAKTVNEMTLNELVNLTTLWTTGPWSFTCLSVTKTAKFDHPKDFCSVFAQRNTIPVCLYGSVNKRLNYIARFGISAIVPKCQPYFNWHPPSTLSKLTLRNHRWKISLRFSFSQHGVARVEISSRGP